VDLASEPEPNPARWPAAVQGAVDTHCHLYLIEEDPGAVVAEARQAGVDRMVCVGIDPESSRRSMELAESFRGVFATAGMHPHKASAFDQVAGSDIEALLADPLVIGVGETGLDYYRRRSPPEDQRRAFRTHIALSRETGKPLVVHVREAWEDALAILQEETAERVVLHCFSGDAALAAEAVARGYFLSFAGNLSYPSANVIRASASSIPVDSLLVETDSPFLPPQLHRGEENRPRNVLAVCEELAGMRPLSLEQVISRTAANARRAFPLLQ